MYVDESCLNQNIYAFVYHESTHFDKLWIMFLLCSPILDFRHKKYLARIIMKWYLLSGPPLEISWPVPLNKTNFFKKPSGDFLSSHVHITFRFYVNKIFLSLFYKKEKK